LEYKNEVGRYARSAGYDVASYSHGQETVILNPSAVKSFKHVGGVKSAERHKAGLDQVALNVRFAFHSTPEQLQAFQTWLNQQFADLFLSQQMERMLEVYAEQGMRRGFGRSFDDTKRLRREAYERGDKLEDPATERTDFYEGTKEEFLRSSFARPVVKEKVKVLASRTFRDLKNVTDDTAAKLNRVLTDGLVRGVHPKRLAKELVAETDLPIKRARMIARTEVIRAHAEGQLDALENLGVTEVGVQVEWNIADDDACNECKDMDGEVFDVDEAHGMIPLHPNCRCAFVPALPSWAMGGKK
jgi:SPP1 gp7 family putative phage head morphogenesis protein